MVLAKLRTVSHSAAGGRHHQSGKPNLQQMALGEVLGKHWVYFAISILDVVNYVGILSSAKWVTQPLQPPHKRLWERFEGNTYTHG